MRIKSVLTKATECACISQTALSSSPSLPQAWGARPSAGVNCCGSVELVSQSTVLFCE